MSYSVNLGCWGSIFAVPTDIVDKYLKIAGSAQLKVLLWILRHSGEQFEIEDIAQQLNMGAFDVKDCLEFWTSFNIIAINDNVITPAKTSVQSYAPPVQQDNFAPASMQAVKIQSSQAIQTIEKETANFPVETKTAVNASAAKTEISSYEKTVVQNEQPKAEIKEEKPSDTVMARPLRPDPVYVAKRISEDKEIEALLNEAQYILGRPVSPNENAGMIMLHDNDGLPCEVILMLLTYGASNQKGMRQIEAMGAAWAKEGIMTLEAADEKIRELEESKEAWRKVQSILGLEFRKPTQKEEENYTRWIKDWKFTDDVIKEAYDICVNAKGKYIPNYVNTILMRWYQGGIKTVEQIRAERSKAPTKSNTGKNVNDNGRKSSFDIDDLSGFSMFND